MDKSLKIENVIKSWKDNSNRSYFDVEFLKRFNKANVIVFRHKNIAKTIKELEDILKILKDS